MEQHEILIQISGQLGRLEGKVDGILGEQQRIADYTTATSTRVGVVERKVSSLLGWASGVAAVITVAISFVREWLFGQ